MERSGKGEGGKEEAEEGERGGVIMSETSKQ